MNTRERIISESLKLFAKDGFDCVSVRKISSSVGVRESALYKHFKNKDYILDSVIEECVKRIQQTYVNNQVPEVVQKDIAKGYREMSEEQLFAIAWNLFELYTKDEIVCNFRKLLLREQSKNKKAAKLYDDFFLTGAIKRQSKVFEALVTDGFFVNMDSEIIALHFYGPIHILFQKYDCSPEHEEEIKQILHQHVKAFGGLYEKR